MENKVKGYKVFNPDWTCRGKQYSCPGNFEEDVTLSVCNSGNQRGTEEQEERYDMKPITTDEFRWFCGKLKDVFPNIEFVGGRQSGAAVEITAVIKKPLPVVPTTENKEKKNNHC